MHHHGEEVKISVPALNLFRMLEILNVLHVSGPLSSNKLQNSLRLIRSHEVQLSYLDLLEDMKFISRQKEKFGGGFAPMKSAISISKKGVALLNLIERAE